MFPITSLFVIISTFVFGQQITTTGITIDHPSLGGNSDFTAIYRFDTEPDRTGLRIHLGDESSSDFQIGYTYWQNNTWYSTFSLDGFGNGFFLGNLGIGTSSPAARFHILDGGFRHGGTGEINIDAPGIIGGRFKILDNGNVGIGTNNPTQKLTVNGTVYSKEVKVDVYAGTGPDYVFEPTYQLPSLTEIENYIKANKHLPEVPSAKEMETNGINLSEMNMLLLKKVEELTLHQIEANKKIELLQNQVLELLQNQNKK
ncbi:MAG: hypothetical protein EBR30_28590 [Cytophagia bacterium]|nr:hypothetical protein [Cytophagia bacterium]